MNWQTVSVPLIVFPVMSGSTVITSESLMLVQTWEMTWRLNQVVSSRFQETKESVLASKPFAARISAFTHPGEPACRACH